jgi:hypothetical protein
VTSTHALQNLHTKLQLSFILQTGFLVFVVITEKLRVLGYGA